MSRFLSLLRVMALVGLGLAVTPAQAVDRPNVIVIFIDDQGYYDLGCYGATEIETPRIDAMAEQGIRFTDYYAAAPICSPSRAGLLTGCYPRRIGMEAWVQRADSLRGLHADELTLAELFKEAGYATACIGKWHLGDHEEFHPLSQGFDSYYGLMHNLDPVETVYFEEEGGVPLVRGQDEVIQRPADPAQLTELYTDEAIRFITEKKDDPFFLYLPHTMLHNPLGVSEPFQGSSDWGEYGDAIQELDHNVGRLFDSLAELKLDQKTIVIYASDNGRGPGRNPQQPMQGRKLTTWECGIRVPAILWGPGVGIEAGEENGTPVFAMDWYPTLASFAGIRVPEDRVIDGRDLSLMVMGRSEGVPAFDDSSLNGDLPLRRRWDQGGEWQELFTREEYLNAFFYHGAEGHLAAVRSGDLKLTLAPGLAMYDLAKDPGETKPVRGPEVRKLRGMAILFQEEMSLDARPPGYVE